MKLSRKWLAEFVDLSDISNKDFADAMTLSGSKVEGLTQLNQSLQNVVVGQVTEMHRHENSDHMWVCQVDVGDELLQIVTGAQNVHPGALVPVAKSGSLLPDGIRIESGLLRGVTSNGMLCSLKELGLSIHDYPDAVEDGIWLISEPCRPGDEIAALIGADDTVVEFEITPNRPDCLSVIGLAREAAATFKRPLHLHHPLVKGCGGSIGTLVDIDIENGTLCPRYSARMVKNVKIGPSPAWLRERLRNSGVRPINNIVDITNYVMLEYGQPMHAFDFSCVEGGRLIIRAARQGESIQTLDGNERQLSPQMLCICDETRPVCVAGVMGGANSEIVGDTAMVLFESANFNGVSVRRTAVALGMRTDASARYEKGLDPMNTLVAVGRACELVELLGCGEVVDGVMDVIAADRYASTIPLETERINALLGTDISRDQMVQLLLPLGFTVEGDVIAVPSWREDVRHCADIAEEVARFFGYHNIPTTRMRGASTQGGYTPAQQAERTLGKLCRTCGYSEIITYSFISPTWYDKIRMAADSPLRQSMRILNPLGEDSSILRSTILPSLLETLTRNYNYRNKNVKLYELGKVYLPRADGMADEPRVLALGAYGDEMDFYALKGAVQTVLDGLRLGPLDFEAERSNPSYHPGRCAIVRCGKTLLGVLGQIHPLVAEHYGVDAPLYCAELDFESIFAQRGGDPLYTPLPKFPAITRDIAVLCREQVTVGQLIDCIRRGAGDLLREVTLFDIYRGNGVTPGKKSVAFTLQLRSDSSNLIAAEADAEISSILALLAQELEAELR